MASKISPETKESILREFSKPGATKAGIARKFNISPSTVNRIIATSSEDKENKIEKNVEPSANVQKNGSDLLALFQEEGISESDLKAFLFSFRQSKETTDLNGLFDEFLRWVADRDQLEKEKILASTEMNSMASRKDSMEKELSDLEGKTARLEINVWKMKSAAERAQKSLSQVQGRLEFLENRMTENRDLLVLAAGLKSLIDSGDLGRRVVSLIADPDNIWDPDNRESVERVSRALDRYLQMVSSDLSSSGGD